MQAPIEEFGGERVLPGETKNVSLPIGETNSGVEVGIPVQIRRAHKEGPTVFVTAALHGDEINGTGVIRQLIHHDLQLSRGSLILVPVLNILAFERHSRYLPDRRDLNRSFPGSSTGSLAGRTAKHIFDGIVRRSDFGIDLHTAAVRRTNYPNIRADMSSPEVARIAKAFGTELIMHGAGPKGAFRREACRVGCPTVVFEGGEVCKVEPGIVESAVKGVRNVLRELEMLEGEIDIPTQQTVLRKTSWIRAERGGFLQFHVKPGELVDKEQPLATNSNLLGEEQSVLTAPFAGVVIGMTTLPSISPGEPVCHLGRLQKRTQRKRMLNKRSDDHGLEERLVEELATNVLVTERTVAPE